jgi:hypothetical protein
MSLIVQDWAKFQSGTITSADEVSLLDNIVTLTGKKLTPVEAAALDGAMQQIKGNMNASAPTPLQGGAAAIVQDVINGVARELVIYQTPALASTVGK